MTLSQLFNLDEALHAELDKRSSPEIPERTDRTVVEERTTSAGIFRLELVNCGKCKRCASPGGVHGPYWYGYVKAKGKTRSWYVGKKLKTA